MRTMDLIDDLRSRINPLYAWEPGTESYERRLCAESLETQSAKLDRLLALFKNACQIHTHFMVARYLMANTHGRQSGAEKAHRHIELCTFYVAAFHGSDPERVISDFDDDYHAVHDATQELTDYLDEQIGFPLENEHPDYDKLIPMFFEKFHALAMAALDRTFSTEQTKS